jgi:hypothetical protein
VVEQDSPADLLARAKNVAVCPGGFREDNPDFGIPHLLFRTIPLDVAGTAEAVARWADLDVSASEHAQALERPYVRARWKSALEVLLEQAQARPTP